MKNAKKKAEKEHKKEIEKMNLEIEQAKNRKDLLDQVFAQPLAQLFETFKGFTGKAPDSAEPSDYSNLERYGEVSFKFHGNDGLWRGQVLHYKPHGTGVF